MFVEAEYYVLRRLTGTPFVAVVWKCKLGNEKEKKMDTCAVPWPEITA